MKRLIAATILLSTSLHPAIAEAATLEDLLAIGQPIYEANCAECHSKSGGGRVGPSFLGNDRIGNAGLVLRQVTEGGTDMPSFGTKLSADEILAVGTYIRNSWGNAYGVLNPGAE